MSDSAAAPAGRRSTLVLVPVLLFAVLAGLFLVRLFAGDPQRLPSALIGKPVPGSTLPALPGLSRDGQAVPGFDAAALKGGKPTLVNVFASWCPPCHEEHPQLMALAAKGIDIVGLNYKDPTDAARKFLAELGNPYRAVGVDRDGRVAIDWGVYGQPETFLVNGQGTIVWKHVGPLTPDVIQTKLAPELARLGVTLKPGA